MTTSNQENFLEQKPRGQDSGSQNSKGHDSKVSGNPLDEFGNESLTDSDSNPQGQVPQGQDPRQQDQLRHSKDGLTEALKAERRRSNQLEKDLRGLKQQLNRFSEINPEEYSRLQEAERQKRFLEQQIELPPVSAKKSARIKETTRGCNR